MLFNNTTHQKNFFNQNMSDAYNELERPKGGASRHNKKPTG